MRRAASALALTALSACTVGPTYKGPPAMPAYAAQGSGFVRAGGLGQVETPSLAPWWRALGDPILDDVMARALEHSPTVAIARARVGQARAEMRLQTAGSAPVVQAGAAAAHGGAPGIGQAAALFEPEGADDRDSTDLFAAGFDALWEIDLFGGRRRMVEAARAGAEGADAALEDARLSLTAEVARTYVGLRSAQRRLELARQQEEAQTQVVVLTRQLVDAGKVSSMELEQARGQLETIRLGTPLLQAQIDASLDALAVLAGEAPGALDDVLAGSGPIPLPPAVVAVDDPEAMLRRRPDIRAAERRLAAATAGVGVAEAARLPRLTLLGVIGIGGTLTGLDNAVSLAAPSLQWNIADFGRGAAGVGQAESRRDEAEAVYRGAVLAALQDAEGALSRFGAARATVAVQARANESAAHAAGLTQQRFRAGRVSRIEALGAERQRLGAMDALSTSMANLTIEYVALQKALALGWSTSDNAN